MTIYPLKFVPLLRERIWGGRELGRLLSKPLPPEGKFGESWELSAIPGNNSVVAEGPLAGRSLMELIDLYGEKLLGREVTAQCGKAFPILIKFIDAQDDLSIQVHPDDRLARRRHGSAGKTEMWYVVQAAPHAALYVGFHRPVTREEYRTAVQAGTLPELLNRIPVQTEDTFFIPAGTIHAIGRGCLIAEIQQSSDITYRIDDWGRTDEEGHSRQLHTEQALDAIDFPASGAERITKEPRLNTPVVLVRSPYFTTGLIHVKGEIIRDYSQSDSFVVLLCTAGSLSLEQNAYKTSLQAGDTVLLPACFGTGKIRGIGTLLEISY